MKDWLVAIPTHGRPGCPTLARLVEERFDLSRVRLFFHSEEERTRYREINPLVKSLRGHHCFVSGASSLFEQQTYIMETLYGRDYIVIDDDVKMLCEARQVFHKWKAFPIQVQGLWTFFAALNRLGVKSGGWGPCTTNNPMWAGIKKPCYTGKVWGRVVFGIRNYKCKLDQWPEDIMLPLQMKRDGAVGVTMNRLLAHDFIYQKGGALDNGSRGEGKDYKWYADHDWRLAQRFRPEILSGFGSRKFLHAARMTREEYREDQRQGYTQVAATVNKNAGK